MADSFPRQYARTQRFTLGEPRDVTVAADGSHVAFLRSLAGDDSVNGLWVKDLPTGTERLVANPRTLRETEPRDLAAAITDEEGDRRERMRDGSTGITAYTTDREHRIAAFALDGELYTTNLLNGETRHLPIEGSVFDPRLDPTARRVAYVSGRQLWVAELDGSLRAIAGDRDEPTTVSWGLADFIAAEEMRRFRGYWWNPDGERLVVCRVDTAPVSEWFIADPSSPNTPPRTIRYPAAGTPNAEVTLHLIGLDGSRADVNWDRELYPYLALVEWTDAGLMIACWSRDQRKSIVATVDTDNIHNDAVDAETVAVDDDDAWIEKVPGLPKLLDGGRILTHSDGGGARRLILDEIPVTPTDIQVRSVVDTASSSGEVQVVLLANRLDAPTELHVWIVDVSGDGTHHARPLTSRPGVHSASVGGSTIVLRRQHLAAPGATFTIHKLDGATDLTHDCLDYSSESTADITFPSSSSIVSVAETPSIAPNVRFLAAGERRLATAVLFPTGMDPDTVDASDGARLPVLLDPYGGPHVQRVIASYDALLTSQWFADQGFCVIVVDGRGTPARGSEWERAVLYDLASAPLNDQVDALHAVSERFDLLDLSRVAIRGWSFGGYLAALAVLRRPDVFHAAISGAPVTEWRMYDTHYTERYLRDPHQSPEVYDANSLLPLAAELKRPLLLVHGLGDDNVVAAHTLRLSSSLLAAGRPHEVLPLVGVTHMTPQEVVAEHLLLHQLNFLRRALGE